MQDQLEFKRGFAYAINSSRYPKFQENTLTIGKILQVTQNRQKNYNQNCDDIVNFYLLQSSQPVDYNSSVQKIKKISQSLLGPNSQSLLSLKRNSYLKKPNSK